MGSQREVPSCVREERSTGVKGGSKGVRNCRRESIKNGICEVESERGT